MLVDGIYEVAYFDADQPHGEPEHLLAICRNGTLTGSDRFGSLYLGDLAVVSRDASRRYALDVQCAVPPGGVLVTGFAAGAEGASARITGEVAVGTLLGHNTILVEGRPVEIEISYLGPLPA